MAAILSAILVIECQTKPVFKLEREVNESNPYMKFGRNPIKMTELAHDGSLKCCQDVRKLKGWSHAGVLFSDSNEKG